MTSSAAADDPAGLISAPAAPAPAANPGAPAEPQPASARTADPAAGSGSVPPIHSVNAAHELSRLRFAPATRVFRRSAAEIQLERGPRRVVVANLPDEIVARLARPGAAGAGAGRRAPVPGTATGNVQIDSAAPKDRRWNAAGPVPVEVDAVELDAVELDGGHVLDSEVGQVLRALVGGGFLTPARAAPPIGDHDSGSTRSGLLAPDRAALDDRFGRDAVDVLERRGDRSVRVHGTGRLPASVAALLAAAGVGRVHLPDSADVSLRDALPGGLRPEDEGVRTARAATDAVRRAHPGVDTARVSGHLVDLAIVTDGTPVAPELRAILLAEGRPHLVTGVWGAEAVIGPLVVPGHTSCLECADLHRRDRDPAWPALAAQLSGANVHAPPSEVAVCTLATAVTVLQALAFLDGERPATADGTLELRLPDWRLRRRHWSQHSDCPCAA